MDWFDNIVGIENLKIGSILRIKLPQMNEEIKMTREEAKKKLVRQEHYNKGSSIDWFLDQLEALGLIKFEEEIDAKLFIALEEARSSIDNKEYLKRLACYGYKIVKA